MNKLILFCLTLLFSFYSATANLWDNMFSQLRSPQLAIPDETKVEFFNQGNKMMEVLLSNEFNMAKISFINKALAKNLTDVNDFLDVYVNLNNGTVYFDWSDNCTYRNTSNLNKFKLKFFLTSYDILTFFNNTEMFYEYVFTNPLHNGKNLNPGRTSQNKFLGNEKDSLMGKLEYFTNLLSDGLFDKESKITFRVEKTKHDLEQVLLELGNLELALDTKSTIVDSFRQQDFQIKHNCTLIAFQK